MDKIGLIEWMKAKQRFQFGLGECWVRNADFDPFDCAFGENSNQAAIELLGKLGAV